MESLLDYRSNVFSQYGEDGMLEHVLQRLGIFGGLCVEFGAWESPQYSNVANLWKHKGWAALLIESDKRRCASLKKIVDVEQRDDLEVMHAAVTPTGPNSITALLDGRHAAVISIDIDGDDYYVLKELECQPDVLVVEYNPTMPPHADIYGDVGSEMGASLEAIRRLGKEKGYSVVGFTPCNVIMVLEKNATQFQHLDTVSMLDVQEQALTYVATDYRGRYFFVSPEVELWDGSNSFRPAFGLSSACRNDVHVSSGRIVTPGDLYVQQPVSVIIPYRSDNGGIRDRRMAWVVSRYNKLLVNGEVVLGLEDEPGEYFCRSNAINNGARRAQHSVLLIADGDAVFFPDALDEALRFVLEQKVAWVIPYKDYHELDEASTERILAECDPGADPTLFAVPEATYDASNASLAVVSTENFWAIGGFDERFIGWAPEDQAWASAMQTMIGPPERVMTHDMLHLWHPIRVGHRQDNPHYLASELLWNEYRKANTRPNMMAEVLER